MQIKKDKYRNEERKYLEKIIKSIKDGNCKEIMKFFIFDKLQHLYFT